MQGGGGECLPVVVGGQGVRKKGKNNKRRFSDEQIQSLETMFEEETKLEPRKKLQLARELGLQPRQVAIWFQNRRARWKSKKLEREYNVLKADYDALAQSFESLKKERQSLLKQVLKLTELAGKPEKESERRGAYGDDFNSGVAATLEEAEEKPKVVMGEGADLGLNVCSDGENSIKCMERFGPEESDLMPIVERAGNGWPEEWGDLDSGSFSDQSSCTMEWWDFWV